MRSPVMLIIIGLAITTAVALIGQALDFSGLAWILALIAIALAVSVFDRERFYGPRTPHRH